jgi:hypothetical protein
MIGNAVPVNFSYAVAQAIYDDLFREKPESKERENTVRSRYS